MKSSVYVEFSEKQIAENELVATAKRIWVDNGHKASELKSLQLYIKPEDNTVYCVFNQDIEEKFTLD
jgi:hypothetical protein